MKKLKIEAKIENLAEVTSFIETEFESIECKPKVIMQINLAVEEIFVNIAHYAYGKKDSSGRVIPDTGTGPVEIIAGLEGENIKLTFIDEGTEYNPLQKEDPDITLSAEDRGVGGLGIFMVKKTMDEISYTYESGKNILTLIKK